jgi:hypothetical protein
VIERALVNGDGRIQRQIHISIPKTNFAIGTQQKPLPPIFVTSSHPKLLEPLQEVEGDAVPYCGQHAWVAGSLQDGRRAEQRVDIDWRAAINQAARHHAVCQHHRQSRRSPGGWPSAHATLGAWRIIFASQILPLDEKMDSSRNEPYRRRTTRWTNTPTRWSSATRIPSPRKWSPTSNALTRATTPAISRSAACLWKRAHQSIVRFKKEVVPLIEKELGPLSNIGVESIASEEGELTSDEGSGSTVINSFNKDHA